MGMQFGKPNLNRQFCPASPPRLEKLLTPLRASFVALESGVLQVAASIHCKQTNHRNQSRPHPQQNSRTRFVKYAPNKSRRGTWGMARRRYIARNRVTQKLQALCTPDEWPALPHGR